jgi:DNA-binding NarL/FixJ family response regulator
MTIALIDDHELIAKAITYMLLKDPGITEVKLFATAPLFLESLDGPWKPDVIITDLLLPVMGGIELLGKIGKIPALSDTKIIVLSSVTDIQTVRYAFKTGAHGYLSKDCSFEELKEALQSVRQGKQYIARKLEPLLVDSVFSEDPIQFHLSPREKNVLDLICSGLTIKEVAAKLDLSVHTVQSYHKNIMKKFKVNRTPDLIKFALEKGLYISN